MKKFNQGMLCALFLFGFQFQASCQSSPTAQLERLTSRRTDVVGRRIFYSTYGQEIRPGVRTYENSSPATIPNVSRESARQITTERTFESVRPISRHLGSTNSEKFIQALVVCHTCMRSLASSYTSLPDQQNIYRFQNNLFSATQYLNLKPDDDKIKFAAAVVVDLIAQENINITTLSQVENLRIIARNIADDCVVSSRDSVSPIPFSDDYGLQ